MNSLQNEQLIAIINQFTPQNIMVIGDLMLDQYIWGHVDRISPEAPIPVIKMEREEFRLGGAANVAANVAALSCNTYPIGVIGQGSAGKQIKNIFDSLSIQTEGIISTPEFQTTVKQRILTEQQQLLRVDYESGTEDGFPYEKALIDKIMLLMPKMNGIILSDYAKGVLSDKLVKKTISEAHKLDIPIMCDPGKGIDFSRYYGITAIKPNRFETEQLTNIVLKSKASILEAASIIKKKSGAKFLTISLDKDGILLFYNKKKYHFFETKAREVFDVTGAGDTVVAIIGVLTANQIAPEISVQIANVGAELEISHMGVVSIKWQEITDYLLNDNLNKKITTLDQLVIDIKKLNDTPLVFTNGYFDNISAGHLRFLLEIGNIPGKLIVAINSDESIFNEKGSYPLLKEQDRARLLASLENVYRVIIYNEKDASKTIKTISPNIIVKGEKFKNLELPEKQAIEDINAKLEFVKFFQW